MNLVPYSIINSVTPYVFVSKSILQVLHSGISNTLSLIRSISSISNLPSIDPINKFLVKSDLLVKLEIMDLLLIDIKNKDLKPVQIKCLNKISDLIENIKNLLNNIKIKINMHSEKYFSYYRVLDLNEELNKLNDYTLLLDSRIDLLLKMLKLNFE